MNLLRNLPFLEDKPSSTLMPLQGNGPLHFDNNGEKLTDIGSETELSGFDQLMMSQLNRVNDQQMESELLQQQMLVSPDSVDVHTVTLAMSKANMSLSITKAVVDRALQAYREIGNLR